MTTVPVTPPRSSYHEDNPNPLRVLRVDVSPRKQDMLRRAVGEMFSGYPFLGSIASSDSVCYHGVRTNLFRWAATDGVSIALNDTSDGFFENPGDTSIPHTLDAAALPPGMIPGQPVSPAVGSDNKPMNDDERLFAVAHEVLHICREDVLIAEYWRTQGFVPVDRAKFPDAADGRLPYVNEVFQIACDAQINGALIQDAVGRPPAGVVNDPDINWSMPLPEAYAITYAKFKKLPKLPPQHGSGRVPGKGGGSGAGGTQGNQPNLPNKNNQGNGDILRPGQLGEPNDSTDPNDPSTSPVNPGDAARALEEGRAEREANFRQAQEIARRTPGSGTSAVEQMIVKARVTGIDWRDYVFGQLSRRAGADAWDWSRPMRAPLLRGLMGVGDPYFMPARGGHGINHVVLVQDTSGSIGEAEHRVFLGVIADMLAVLKPKLFTIMFCDTAVQRVDEADPESDFSEYNIPRGGGTDFCPPFAWVEENISPGDYPDILLYLTDGYGSAPHAAPPYPVLWCMTTDLKAPLSGGEWGNVINIPVSDLNPPST